MQANVEELPNQSTSSLLSEIVTDLQYLIAQQIQLTRSEINGELRQCATAGTMVALGLGTLFLDAIVLCQTAVHLLHWLMSPPGVDAAALPLWACYAVVSVALGIVGGFLAFVGRANFRLIHASQLSAIEIPQEPAPWTTPPK